MHEVVTQLVETVMVVAGVLGRVVQTAWIVIGSLIGVEEAFEIVVHMMEAVEGHLILEMKEDIMYRFLIDLVAEDLIIHLLTDL